MRTQNKKRSKGFTLLEALFAAMLIGLMVAAIAVSSGASTMVNGVSIDLSTGEFLIEEFREYTTTLEYTDLPALAGNHLIDAAGIALPTEFNAFSQQVTVQNVQDNDMTQVDTTPDDSHFVRITVTITKNNIPISSAIWIRAEL